MTLRCKPGDLAIIIRSLSGLNHGIFVTVEYARPRGFHTTPDGRTWGYQVEITPTWVVSNTNMTLRSPTQGIPIQYICILDSHLRPIRDADGCDETLAWADVPNKEFA